MLAGIKTFKFNSIRFFQFALAIAIVTLVSDGQLYAQFGGGGVLFNNRPVGGVKIDANGVLQNGAVRLDGNIANQIQQKLKTVDADIEKSGMRMISLNALENKMVDCKNNATPFPAELRYMAGLQRIEYVILSDDDVILAGPGEGFKTNANGEVVGEKSGMPVIQLEDFLVAMRSANNARQGYGITVSIDPTQEGVRNVEKMMRNYTVSSFNSRSAREL